MKDYFILKQDNDGHWYLIPSKLDNVFEEMISNIQDSELCSPEQAFFLQEFENKINKYAIDNPHTIKIFKYEK